MSADTQKKAAALEALKVVTADVKIGLGTGTTANHFIIAAAEKVKREKLNTIFVPTSAASYALAQKHGLNLQNIEDNAFLDFTVDGADEIDPQFRMIKGGGGALHREKIVASSSRFVICICDESKKVETLGKFPLPVEVSKYGVNPTAWKIERLLHNQGFTNAKMRLRAQVDGKPFVTEGGNAIIDLQLGAIPDPDRLEASLKHLPGVIECGLFIGICGIVMMATENGVEEITRP
ncbi:ribose-5-phosphate isomerase RpiA [Aestuariivirga litoralis]|uniref:ribose-5-phosphate isomerase RpiA n=1 Tax=Aestuariivirga litoralis TaxID=2650924 RepID=UPI0018C6F194|nr:ribose-5-phosphate isomerase RpiA [Aestuariivirga litoralis]MBG1232103.1 ribose-5-phosphate isomerase RpiA [Aestuariivirga litoralis]